MTCFLHSRNALCLTGIRRCLAHVRCHLIVAFLLVIQFIVCARVCARVCEYRSKYDKGLEEWRQLCDKQAGELRQLRDDRQELTNQLSGHHVNIGKLESDVSTFLISLRLY